MTSDESFPEQRTCTDCNHADPERICYQAVYCTKHEGWVLTSTADNCEEYDDA